jgi:RNA polymerase sigma-70 factor (ECF subfamily)
MMTMARGGADLDFLLEQARAGDAESRGLLLDRYRNYLSLLARGMIGGALRVSLDASDLVQQTFLEAHRDLPQFRGSGERELAAWLRRILIRNLNQQAEYNGRQRRGRKHRVSLDVLLERSSQFVCRARAHLVASPSEQAVRREQAVLLADALARLPEDQRTALELHHLQGLSVPEVSRKMGRGVFSVTGLIYRGMRTLRELLTSTA